MHFRYRRPGSPTTGSTGNPGAPRARRGLAIAAATVIAFAALGVLLSSSRAQQSPSVWDGVYTEEQARRGEKIYSRECASCHGNDMAGVDEATALAGPAFLANWDGLTVGDLSERTRRSMPPSKPGRLSRQEIADILCYVLRVNSFPAGKTELAPKTELLKQIRIEATKPRANSDQVEALSTKSHEVTRSF